jgi:Zn-dependent peptidase ImmA (M78 family)
MLKTREKYLSAYRKNEISELAEFVAESYCPSNLVNPELIAKERGISFSQNDYGDYFDGLIEHLNSKFHIYINTGRLGHSYTTRARYTFGHELGHYFLDGHRNALASGEAPAHSSFTNFKSEIYTEWEADYFSACLLMPEKRFKKDCFRRKFTFSILDELSKKYQTSLTSTAIRFAEIGNHPLMIVFCENGQIKWYWYSDDFPYNRLLHGKFKIPSDTVIGEYFSEGKKYTTTQEVWAIDWFNRVPNFRTSQKFREHCIPYKNMAMSIIWED